MTLHIQKGGALTTVQDRGRYGHQIDGVPVGGAMDLFALRCANILAGNTADAAALEITLLGPTITFGADVLLALAGADLGAFLDDAPFPPWRAAVAKRGSTLGFRGSSAGAYAYLALAGGIDVPIVLGSRSTYLRAGFGGIEGRALRAGDQLASGASSERSAAIGRHVRGDSSGNVVARWGVGPSMIPAGREAPIRLIEGTHSHLLAESARDALTAEEFRLSPQSDRMGYRFQGPTLHLREPTELLSEGVTFGTMQLPPGGDPIILMADRQTTGGYPRIGEVASVDLSRLAQRRPGDGVRFSWISVDEAQRLIAVQENDLAQLERAIGWRVEP